MSIWLDSKSKVIVQGITGKNGQFHTEQMLDYGTKVLGGVTPGKGGQETLGVPIWNTVNEAVDNGANVSCVFVPPPFAADESAAPLAISKFLSSILSVCVFNCV